MLISETLFVGKLSKVVTSEHEVKDFFVLDVGHGLP